MNTSVKLSNEHNMPLVGLGTTSELGDVNMVKADVYEQLQFGYRRIECGGDQMVQKYVGEAIAKAIEDGLVTRQELWVTCKLRRDYQSSSEIENILRASLRLMNLDYFDLYLVGWPGLLSFNSFTWFAMEKVQQKGLARSIGVCHVTIKKLKDMSTYARIMPAVCKVDMNPMLRQDELLDYCKVEGIHVTALDPMGSFDTADTYRHTRLSPKFSPLQKEIVQAIAIELNKSPAQVLVRWALQRGTSVVVKPSVNLSCSMRKVLDVFDWELSAGQFHELSILDPQEDLMQSEANVTKNGNSH